MYTSEKIKIGPNCEVLLSAACHSCTKISAISR